MSSKIIVYGNASKKTIKNIELEDSINKEIHLMDFLRGISIPVASSCYGEGICHKCTIKLNNTTILSCQVLVKDLKNGENTIVIDYL